MSLLDFKKDKESCLGKKPLLKILCKQQMFVFGLGSKRRIESAERMTQNESAENYAT